MTLLIIDPKNPYRYLEVAGVVDSIDEDVANALLDELTQVYMGKAPFFGEIEPVETGANYQGVVLKIRPTRTFAYTGLNEVDEEGNPKR